MSLATPDEDPEAPTGAVRDGQAGTSPTVSCPVRQGVARRHPRPRLRAQPCERRGAGRGRGDLRRHRGAGVTAGLASYARRCAPGRYTPQPVRRVMIPKASGVGQRPLGIPTIRDRVVQTAAMLVLEPIFEADFDEAAYGYRPKRSALEAVRQVSTRYRRGTHRSRGRRSVEVLRHDSARRADDVRRAPHQRRPDAAADQAVAEGAGRRDRRAGESPDEWRKEGDAGNTARRSGFAVTGEHLHASVHQGVSAARPGPSVRRGAGHLCGRLRHSLPSRGGTRCWRRPGVG